MLRSRSGMSTRLLIATIAGALLLVGLIGVIILRTTGIGVGGLGGAANRLEDWIGSQIVGVANSYLVPQIAYDEIDYRHPGTVELGGVRFTSPDGTRVIELERMTVTLAEVPTLGEPILISRIAFDRPVVRLIRQTRPDGTAGFKGLAPIVKRSHRRDEDVEAPFRLSNVLRLERIEIREGAFVYDEGAGDPPMKIAGLSTEVLTSPGAAEPGWYDLDIESALGPLAGLALRGSINLDTLVAEIESLSLQGMLSDESVAVLPPRLQTIIREHEAQGRMTIAASGSIPLTEPASGTLDASLSLADFRVVRGAYHVPIQTVDARVALASGVATLSDCSATLLGGRIGATGEARLTETERPGRVEWEIANIELRELLRTNAAADSPPRLAGTLNASGVTTTRLAAPREGLGGSGELAIRDGTLVLLPVIGEIAEVMSLASADLLRDGLSHKADAEFEITPDGVRLTKSQVTADLVGMRIRGDIKFDGALDLTVNAGPMEKLQSLLGDIGDAVGALTDQLVKYRVRGTLKNPEVSIAPLGVGG